jgi:hypothetical protein
MCSGHCSHYNNKDDMPFGHDVADPFSHPYIKYRLAKKSFHVLNKQEVEIDRSEI